jgi:hypothetical protein
LVGGSAYYGGGIFNASNATTTVTGCTLSSDTAYSLGGGIFNYKGGKLSGNLTVSDSVFSHNSPDNIYGQYKNGGGNTFSKLS